MVLNFHRQLQESFKQLEGDLATVRDYCFKEHSVCVTDLKNYDNADDVPEKDLCFYKCFYEQIGFIDDGKIVLDDLRVIPEVKDLEDEKYEELSKCLGELDNIVECNDLRQIEECFNEIMQ